MTSADDLSATATSDPSGGYACLQLVMALAGRSVGADQLAHDAGIAMADAAALVRAARQRGWQAKLIRAKPRDLAKLPLPAIVGLKDGTFEVLARASATQVLVQTPLTGTPQTLAHEDWAARWTGEVIHLGAPKDDEAPVTGFAWFMPVLQKYAGPMGQIGLASILLQLFGIATPLFVMVVIDRVLTTGGLSTLDVLALGLLLVAAFELTMNLARTYLLSFVSNRIDVELQARLFRHLSSLPLSFFSAAKTGALAARMQDLQTVRAFLTGASVTTVIDAVFGLLTLLLLAWFVPVLTAVVAIVLVVIALIYGLITPAVKARLQKKAGQQTEAQAFLVEAVAGIETSKSLAIENQQRRAWEDHVAKQTASGFAIDRVTQAADQTVTFLNRAMVAITLWLAATMVVDGSLTAGQMIAFNMLAGRVLAPAQRLAQLWQQLQGAKVALDRIGEILSVQPEPALAAVDALPRVKGAVRFDAVRFRYGPQSPEVLKDVSFAVQPGDFIGIVGSSGSGKSTIARLMQRLYTPEQGKVTVDGVDLAMIDPVWLRRTVGYVVQDNFLFNRSVRDNIAIGNPLMAMDQVVAAATKAGAHEFILSLPQAYDTVLGERGATLSGGQRQRVALARALATDPALLILDEATSALDSEAELAFRRALVDVRKERTVIAIAHRLSTVRDADRILVVEGGRIVEDGSPAQLLARNGRFAQLWRLQLGDLGSVVPGRMEVANAAE